MTTYVLAKCPLFTFPGIMPQIHMFLFSSHWKMISSQGEEKCCPESKLQEEGNSSQLVPRGTHLGWGYEA